MTRMLRHAALILPLLLALPLQAAAGSPAGAWSDDDLQPWWFGLGLGGVSMRSSAPAPSAGREGLADSLEFGYRVSPNVGLGLEFGAVGPVSGCRDWQCGRSAADFAPSFSHMMAFGELRPRDSGWRLRAGVGMSRFCHERYWSPRAWSVLDTVLALLDDDYLYYADGGSGAYRCAAARRTLGAMVSVGYEWRVAPYSPVRMGMRLSGEAADYSARPGISMPAFRHRALIFTLQLQVN